MKEIKFSEFHKKIQPFIDKKILTAEKLQFIYDDSSKYLQDTHSAHSALENKANILIANQLPIFSALSAWVFSRHEFSLSKFLSFSLIHQFSIIIMLLAFFIALLCNFIALYNRKYMPCGKNPVLFLEKEICEQEMPDFIGTALLQIENGIRQNSRNNKQKAKYICFSLISTMIGSIFFILNITF